MEALKYIAALSFGLLFYASMWSLQSSYNEAINDATPEASRD